MAGRRADGSRAGAARRAAALLSSIVLLFVSTVVAVPAVVPAASAALPDPSPGPALVSVDATEGTTGPGASTAPNVSPDGFYAGYITSNDLAHVPGFVAGPHVVVSRYSWDTWTVDPSQSKVVDPADVVVSDRGNFVAFTALRSPGDPSSGRSVYTVDLTIGRVQRVDPDPDLVTDTPTISDDGQTIAYSAAPASDPADTQIRVWHRSTGATQVVSKVESTPGNGASTRPALSGNGHFVAFTTAATNLVAGMDTHPRHLQGGTEAVIENLATGVVSLLSFTSSPTETAVAGDSFITGPDALSTDGTLAVFGTDADAGLFDSTITGDQNAGTDLVRRNVNTGDGRVVTRSKASPTNTCNKANPSTATSPWAAIDDAGDVVFSTTCDDLIDDYASDSHVAEVFQSDGTTATLLSHYAGSTDPVREPDVNTLHPSVSTSGDQVIWASVQPDADVDPSNPDDANGVSDVFRSRTGAEADLTGVVVGASSARDACPSPTRSITADWPTGGSRLALTDASMDVGYTVSVDATDETVELGGVAPTANNSWQNPARALVLAMPTASGGTRYVVYDTVIRGLSEIHVPIPEASAGDLPTAAALCVPALPAYGPKAFPDSLTVPVTGEVRVDALANDEGDLDPSSLTVDSTSGGSASVVTVGGHREISYTAPASPGMETISYEVADYGGTTTSSTVTVDVRAIQSHPLTLATTTPTVPPDTDTTATVSATNTTGAAVDGSLVSLRVDAPATIEPSGSGWTCTRAADDRSATCTNPATVADGAAFPTIGAVVRTPAGPQQPCVAASPTGTACVIVHLWNGGGTDEATATPAPIRAALPYSGGVLRIGAVAQGPFATGSLATYLLSVEDASGTPLPAGTAFEVASARADMPFVGGSSPGVSCVQGSAPDRGLCTLTATLDQGTTLALSVLFTTGDGVTSGCPAGVRAPCALLGVTWVDKPSPTLRVPIASAAAEIQTEVNPIPPDAGIQITHSPVAWTTRSTSARIVVANAGLGPTTDPISVSFTWPSGFTAVSATGSGWTCDTGATTRCKRTTPLAAGAFADPIVVVADVAADATDGSVTATVSTTGDSNAADNSMTSPYHVLDGNVDDPDGPAHVVLNVDSPLTISPGATIDATATLVDTGTEPVAGPSTVTVLVPDGLPAGQVLTVAQHGPGWSCVDTALSGKRELRCTTSADVPAGGQSPDLDLTLTGTVVTPGSSVDVTFTNQLDGTTVSQTRRFVVTQPRIVALALSGSQDAALQPGGRAILRIDGRNVATAQPTAALDARIDLPQGVTWTGQDGSGWTCTGKGSANATCSSPVRPLPGSPMPSIVLDLQAAADLAIGTAHVHATIDTADTIDTRSFALDVPLSVEPPDSGAIELSRTGLAESAVPDRPFDYQIDVRNVGKAALSGDLTVSETLPAGSDVTGIGSGWSCTVSATTLTCTAAGADLALGARAPPLDVEATFPARLAGGQAQLSARGVLGPASARSAAAVVIREVAPPVPDAEVNLSIAPSVLDRGGRANAAVTLKNAGTAPIDGPFVLGIVGTPGLVPTDATGTGWACTTDAATTTPVVACRHTDPVNAGADAGTLRVDYDVADGAAAPATLAAGIVPGVTTTSSTTLAKLTGIGTAALDRPVSLTRQVEGLLADAGPDQTVPERTKSGDGTVPTSVRLNARDSSVPTGHATFTWTQTQGPAVTWQGSTTTVEDADGSPMTAATGALANFEVPRLAASQPVTLRFQLAIQSGNAMAIDTVDIDVTPTADSGPTLGTITTTLDQIAAAPAAGTAFDVHVPVHDPEGDAATVNWSIGATDGSAGTATIVGSSTIAGSGGTATATVHWPEHATYLVVEAHGTSARGATSSKALVIGKAPPPPTVSLTGPSQVASGAPVTVTAHVSGGDPAKLIWYWKQTSGPAIDPAVLAAAQGPTLAFDAPAVATQGAVITLSAVVTRVAGAASVAAPATISIRLEPLTQPTLAITGATTVDAGSSTTLTLTGAPAGSTITWTRTSGPAASFSSPHAASTTFEATEAGTVGIEASVVDPTGRTSSVSTEITVGSPVEPSTDTSCAAADSLLGQALAAATGGDALSVDVGPVGLTLAGLSITAPCNGSSASLSFADSSFTIAHGTVTGTGLSGTITSTGVCLTGGSLHFPASWGVDSATLASTDPICVSLDPDAAAPVTGSMTMRGLPLLKLPAGVSPPTTTVTFDGDKIDVTSDAALPGNGTLHVEVSVDVKNGTFSGSANGHVTILGTAVDFAGSLSYDGTALAFSIDGSVPGPITITPGTTLADLTLHVDQDGFSFGGSVSVDDKIDLTAHGAFSDAQHWSLSVQGATGKPDWSPVPGIELPAAKFAGSISRDGGPVSFDVSAGIDGTWDPTPGVSISNLTARLGNVTPPDSCPKIPAGKVWVAIDGAATIELGSSDIALAGSACIAPATGHWSFSTTAALDSFKPISTLDVTVQSLGVTASEDGTGVQLLAYGSARALGADFAAVITNQPATATAPASLVVDAFGSLSTTSAADLLPTGVTGHVLLASADRKGYHFYRAGTIPEIDPDLAAVKVQAGITLYATITVGEDLQNLLANKLGLPAPSALVVSMHVGPGAVMLTATVTFGDPTDGYTVYENCGSGPCTEDTRTRLALTGITLTMSAGSNGVVFGFIAAGRLDLPRSGDVPASHLALAASVTIDLAKLTISASLYTTDGTWHNALGVDGLAMTDLALTAGVDFSKPIPLPEFGFAATISEVPTSWAHLLGLPGEPDEQEPITFGLDVSTATPVLDIEIGTKDGHNALEPLAPLGVPDAGNILGIDAAHLVIAPFGGTIGNKTYRPGISLGFTATIEGVSLDAELAVDLSAPSITGTIAIGDISIGGFHAYAMQAAFALTPKAPTVFSLKLSGDFAVPLGATTLLTAGSLEVVATRTAVSGSLDIDAQHVGLAGVAMLDDLHLHGALAVGGDDPPSVELGVTAHGTVLGTANVAFGGELRVDGGKLTKLAVAASVDATFGPVALTGAGCEDLSTSGACVSFSDDGGQVAASLAGELDFDGVSIQVSGAVAPGYVQASGSVSLPGVGDFALSGALYFGSADQLDGIHAVDGNGRQVQVQSGDFDLAAAFSPATLNGFGGSLQLAAKHIGTTGSIAASGWISVPGGYAQGSASFSMNGSTLLFDFRGDAALALHGFTLASARVHVWHDATSTGGKVDASIDLPLGSGAGVAAHLAGSISMGPGGYDYDLTGSVDFDAVGMALTADLELQPSAFGFSVDLSAASLFDVTLHGYLNLSDTFNLYAATSIGPVGASLHIQHSTGWSFKAQLTYDGHTFAWASFTGHVMTAGVDFSIHRSGSATLGPVRVGGSFYGAMNLVITISDTWSLPIVEFGGDISVHGWFQNYECSGWGCLDPTGDGYHWSGVHDLGTWGASVDTGTGKVCATIESKEFCL